MKIFKEQEIVGETASTADHGGSSKYSLVLKICILKLKDSVCFETSPRSGLYRLQLGRTENEIRMIIVAILVLRFLVKLRFPANTSIFNSSCKRNISLLGQPVDVTNKLINVDEQDIVDQKFVICK